MKLKRTIYYILTAFLGLIFSAIVHTIVEVLTLKYSEQITWYTYLGGASCALHPVLFYGIFIVGIFGGLVLGHVWWKIVYIEKRHWRFKKSILCKNKD